MCVCLCDLHLYRSLAVYSLQQARMALTHQYNLNIYIILVFVANPVAKGR